MRFKPFLAAALLAAWAFSAAALPSVEQVQAEVQQGHYAQAEAMMQEVVAAKPGSARAHYVHAELLAHEKRFDEAAREAASARRIDPAIGFTDPAKFKALEELLQRETRAARMPVSNAAPPQMGYAAAAATRSSGLPGWVWALGLAGVAALVYSMVRRRAAAPMGGIAPAGYGPGYAPGYGPGTMPPGPGGGSGMLGVGLAAAGGLAAGMLAEKMLEGHRSAPAGGLSSAGSDYQPGMFDDVGGNDAAARELEQRPIDFGNGDGWGGDDGPSGDIGGGDGGW